MSKIEKKEILEGIDYSNNKDMFTKLDNLYSSLPKGICTGCGNCCMESVGINLIEFLNIYNYLYTREDLRKRSLDKIIDYYLLEYKEKRPCPFRDGDLRCSIYEVRPLNCRIFGHWDKNDYESNLSTVLKRNNKYSDLINSRYGFKINEGVTNFKINYCYDFKPEDRYLSKFERLEFADSAMILDSEIYRSGLLNVEFKDRGIVEYFIETIIDIDNAYSIKIKISKDDSIRLRTINRIKRLFVK
ncbi:YkgJ family cysteine cluster protein [Metaclostridioides mangenotii]|uniref:YkgJ family cysteine cluster protein n=1 Tax=Metaclostridioides mangenotii TaxID=1540 RepID=UPI0028ED06C8|nr:YkgJ family cysteine cluster protein [Clostridioides mangenotii]